MKLQKLFFAVFLLGMKPIFCEFRKIIVTPAGRHQYLELLHRHLQTQINDFDEWHLWLNTINQTDLDYCKKLAQENHWIKLVASKVEINGNASIGPFFRDYCDPNCVYLRLDDDVVYLGKDFVKKVFQFRVQNPQYFLVYANIINNAVISYFHQMNNRFQFNKHLTLNCFCKVGWEDPKFAEFLLNTFLQIKKKTSDQYWYFKPRILKKYERVSVNAISWLGKEFAQFDGIVGDDEEAYLSHEKPKSIRKRNVVYGDALCVHYSFHPQRKHLDQTGLLMEFRNLAP